MSSRIGFEPCTHPSPDMITGEGTETVVAGFCRKCGTGLSERECQCPWCPNGFWWAIGRRKKYCSTLCQKGTAKERAKQRKVTTQQAIEKIKKWKQEQAPEVVQ